MGDLSAEPSMEEILSSIKRIIAEEGDGTPSRTRRPSRPPSALGPAPLTDDEAEDEVLELSEPMTPPRPDPAPAEPTRSEQTRAEPTRSEPVRTEPMRTAPEPPPVRDTAAESIVSAQAAAASRGALDQLSRLMVKPEPGSDGSLEGLVREMLRPMLREWLDANLPPLVETMVAREISRITGQPG